MGLLDVLKMLGRRWERFHHSHSLLGSYIGGIALGLYTSKKVNFNLNELFYKQCKPRKSINILREELSFRTPHM